MLILNRADLAQGEVQVRGEVEPERLALEGAVVTLLEPLRAELTARGVGDSVLVRGLVRTRARFACRRCVTDVLREVEEPVDLLFAPLDEEEEDALDGELYSFARNASVIDLAEPLREQLMLRMPAYVVCDPECRGLCAQCGADRNRTDCACVPEREAGPWDALRNIKFD